MPDTLREQATKAALDAFEKGDKEAQVEALTTGEIEASLNAPVTVGPKWLRGSTVTTFIRTKAQQLKSTVGGFRWSKKF